MKNLLFLISGLMLLFGGCSPQSEKISSQPQLESETQQEVLYEVWDGEPPDGEALPDFFPDLPQRVIMSWRPGLEPMFLRPWLRQINSRKLAMKNWQERLCWSRKNFLLLKVSCR